MNKKPSANAERMLRILAEHAYPSERFGREGRKIALRTPSALLSSAEVYTPEDVALLRDHFEAEFAYVIGRMGVRFAKSTASEWLQHEVNGYSSTPDGIQQPKTLVLNFASITQPGGRVRSGGHGQEESLCEDSTLLASLESEAAAGFYRIQGSCSSPLRTDAMILSPYVEFFASNGSLLEDFRIVSVLSATPPRSNGDPAVLEEALYQRIRGMLFIAAHKGYKHLILGAWGCGSGGNDPELVAGVFEKALRESLTVTTPDGHIRRCAWKEFFHSVTMAVPDEKNCAAFEQRFSDFYRAEREEAHQKIRNAIAQDREKYLSAIKGSLIGGAIGDALGYPVEFISYDSIIKRYGEGGIRLYDKDSDSGLALISDDTQMTLFTAVGMLVGDTRSSMRGIAGPAERYIHQAYLDWYACQCKGRASDSGHGRQADTHDGISWLMYLFEMHQWRAPGNTCLNALASDSYGTLKDPINNSKGCGGVMRIAPIPLYYQEPRNRESLKRICLTSAKAAALTHGHPLGYMPAAALAHIISCAAFGSYPSVGGLNQILQECMELMEELFEDNAHLNQLVTLLRRAESLSKNNRPDAENIHALGGGWVAEEALAIAVYCCLRYPGDFTKALIASVNHSGDSDSTGSITGNIMGAWLGYEKIDPVWLKDLELKSVVEEVATDLCDHCRMSEYSDYHDPDWERKYIRFGKP